MATGELQLHFPAVCARLLTRTRVCLRSRYPDLVVGNELFLSSLSSVKGKFDDVAPMRLEHGPNMLSVVAFDADSDGDLDVMLLQGPPGSQQPPIMYLNPGSGNFKQVAPLPLSGITPPAGGWKEGTQFTTVKLADGKDAIAITYPDITTPIQLLTQPTGTGPGGAVRKEDWLGASNANDVVELAGSGGLTVRDVVVMDVDEDGVEDVVIATNNGVIMYSTSGESLVQDVAYTAGGDAETIDVFDINGDGTPDVVKCSGTGCVVLWGPDPRKAQADPALDLTQWPGSTNTLDNLVPTGYSIKEVLADKWTGSGYGSLIITAVDASGNTIRKLIETTKTLADAKDLTGAPETDLELSNEAGLEVIDATKVDLNNDGAMDLLLTYEDGTTGTILSTIGARTDLSSLSDSSTGMISDIEEDLNPSVIQTDGGSVSTDGAWKDIESNVGGDVTQWGYGQVVDCTQKTCAGRDNALTGTDDGYKITIGSPVDPSDPSVSDHGPPCALPGSDVVPILTKFYLEVKFMRTFCTCNTQRFSTAH